MHRANPVSSREDRVQHTTCSFRVHAKIDLPHVAISLGSERTWADVEYLTEDCCTHRAKLKYCPEAKDRCFAIHVLGESLEQK